MLAAEQVVIITGGASGIGRAGAELLAQHGATVIIIDSDGDKAAATAAAIRAGGGSAASFAVDVRDGDAVRQLAAEVKETYGRIDVLINNAGITRDGFLTKITREDWDLVVDVNLTGVFQCGQAVAAVMMEQGRGKIINTTSVVGIFGNVAQTNYAATKAGVIGLTKTWAKELGKKGIRVNAVAPGFIETPMTEKVPQKVLDMMISKTPLGTMGRPEDIAWAFLYLVSPGGDFVNGHILSVDGGLVL